MNFELIGIQAFVMLCSLIVLDVIDYIKNKIKAKRLEK